MTIRKLLLGTTALVGAGVLGMGVAPRAASAAEVLPGGALDVTISGFMRFRAHGGQLDNETNTANTTTGLDFSNDDEVHVIVRGKHDATGIEYGGTVELEADTNHTTNSDEEWLFIRGGFGEFRFGDEDGVVDNSSLGGFTVAANSGGIDGDVINALSISAVRPSNTDDSTKIRYYTPSFGGFTIGVDYTPNVDTINSGANNCDSIANRHVSGSNIFEGALVYKGDFAGFGLQASVVGSYGHLATHPITYTFGDSTVSGKNDDTFWTYYGGFAADIFGFKVGAGAGNEDVGGFKRGYGNAGIGAAFGPVNVSLTASKVFSSSQYQADHPWNAVLGFDIGLMPGLVAGAEVSYFDNDLDKADQTTGDDKGVAWLADLRLAF